MTLSVERLNSKKSFTSSTCSLWPSSMIKYWFILITNGFILCVYKYLATFVSFSCILFMIYCFFLSLLACKIVKLVAKLSLWFYSSSTLEDQEPWLSAGFSLNKTDILGVERGLSLGVLTSDLPIFLVIAISELIELFLDLLITEYFPFLALFYARSKTF